MIERSLMQLGDTRRIKNMIERAKAGEDVTIAYIGGSITQGAGATPIHTQSYAYQSWHMFDLAYGNGNNVHLVWVELRRNWECSCLNGMLCVMVYFLIWW